MHLVFWHNIISPHQTPFMRELAETGNEVVVVASEAMSEDRRQFGWSVPSLGPARVILGPDPGKVLQIVESSGADSIHLIAGARGTALGRQAALACRTSGRRIGIITEAPDPRGLGGHLRWVKYSWERITMGKHFDFILAMGQKGVRWFKLCGYPEPRIFPFAYVTDRLSGSSGGKSGNVFRFLFVGQLISRKGVDFLLRALARTASVELSVIGDGPEREGLQKLALECGIADRVFWHGTMDSAQVQARISDADVLVLPSREDGWGAVVNESLMAGTPVICSTACGASELIQHPWLGTVFQANHIASLVEALAVWSAQGTISPEQRQRVRNWAGCIQAPRVARYVAEVLAHVYERGPRPQAPWRSTAVHAVKS
jgi:glycosyltransferase involved in cell wall biosynthesis